MNYTTCHFCMQYATGRHRTDSGWSVAVPSEASVIFVLYLLFKLFCSVRKSYQNFTGLPLMALSCLEMLVFSVSFLHSICRAADLLIIHAGTEKPTKNMLNKWFKRYGGQKLFTANNSQQMLLRRWIKETDSLQASFKLLLNSHSQEVAASMATNFKICVWSFVLLGETRLSLWHTRVSFVQLDKQITPSQLAQAVNTSVSRSFHISVSQLNLFYNAINATSVAEQIYLFFLQKKTIRA